ncbi:MAG: hypothetical protein PUB96_08795 [Helicobacteraceae bacterium]|nr:hypothetical protein [Helicobacteraceae bacterium]
MKNFKNSFIVGKSGKRFSSVYYFAWKGKIYNKQSVNNPFEPLVCVDDFERFVESKPVELRRNPKWLINDFKNILKALFQSVTPLRYKRALR